MTTFIIVTLIISLIISFAMMFNLELSKSYQFKLKEQKLVAKEKATTTYYLNKIDKLKLQFKLRSYKTGEIQVYDLETEAEEAQKRIVILNENNFTLTEQLEEANEKLAEANEQLQDYIVQRNADLALIRLLENTKKIAYPKIADFNWLPKSKRMDVNLTFNYDDLKAKKFGSAAHILALNAETLNVDFATSSSSVIIKDLSKEEIMQLALLPCIETIVDDKASHVIWTK